MLKKIFGNVFDRSDSGASDDIQPISGSSVRGSLPNMTGQRIYIFLENVSMQQRLLAILNELCPTAEKRTFFRSEELIAMARIEPPTLTFLSENLPGSHGILLGKRLAKECPLCSLVFVSIPVGARERLKSLRVNGFLERDFDKEAVAVQLMQFAGSVRRNR